MAARTTAAQDLDTSISDLLDKLDTYFALDGQSGELKNTTAGYFWATLVSKLVGRSRLKPLILHRSLAEYITAAATNTVEARDPFA